MLLECEDKIFYSLKRGSYSAADDTNWKVNVCVCLLESKRERPGGGCIQMNSDFIELM